METNYFVYILTNKVRSVLYIGVTNNLERRLWEHRTHGLPGFTEKYRVDRLVYYKSTPDIKSAIERETQLKTWSRDKKEWLISTQNPLWNDLAEIFQFEDFSARPPASLEMTI